MKQHIKNLKKAQAIQQETTLEEQDAEIKRLACKPGAVVALRDHIERSRNPKPSIPSKARIRINDAFALREALIKRWGPKSWEDHVVDRPKPDTTNGKGPAEKHVAFEDSDGGSSHTLGHEDVTSEVDIIKSAGYRVPNRSAARLQADEEERQRVRAIRTISAPRTVSQMYEGETEAAYGAHLELMTVYLRKLKRAHNEGFEAIKAEADRHTVNGARPRDSRLLTDSEYLSVQQMWIAMQRRPDQNDESMRIAVLEFLEQFPGANKFSRAELAYGRNRGMLRAIVKAIRKANDTELENDKQELTASRTASLEAVWKPTGAALLVRVQPETEAKQAEPTTPVRKTRSGDLPPIPAAPKKPTSKKPTPKKAAPKKPTPKKAAPKKSSPAKPTGIKKTATPTRRSARISAKDH